MADVLGRKSYARIPDVLSLPSLIEVQSESFNWFMTEGLAELFEEDKVSHQHGSSEPEAD